MSSSLQLNVGKTKELVVDMIKKPVNVLPSVIVNGEPVEIVDTFKYLGTHIDNKLTFQENTDFIFKKAMQRLFLLRKLRSFGVSEKVLETVYKSLIQSLLSFNISVWFGNLSVKNRNKLGRVVNLASKIIGNPQDQLAELYNVSVQKKAVAIVLDNLHPLHHHFETLPSGKRFRVPLCRKNMFKRSFIPNAISALNSI